MRVPTRPLLGSVAVAALLLTGCGAPPPGQNGVPPWQQLGLGESASVRTLEATAYQVDGNAVEVEICWAGDPGGASADRWWVWTDQGGGYYASEDQTREPIYGAEDSADCHRGWVEYRLPEDATITHITFSPSSDSPTEFTWQVDKPGA